MNSGIPVLLKLGATITSQRKGILNYFDYKITTAKVESIDNKIKALKRQVNGFRNFVNFKLRLFHLYKQNYSLSG